jgi:hypothetical protein
MSTSDSRWFASGVIACVCACACSDEAGTGTVRVDVSGEEAAVLGFPVGSGEDAIAFADGYTLVFETVLVALETFELRTSSGASAALDADPVVAELHTGEVRAWELEGVPARRWDEVRYRYAPPTNESRAVGGASPDDVAFMVANGYSLYVAGTATDGEEDYPFELGFDFRLLSSGCENGVDGTLGLVVPANGVVDAEITVHLDHLFFDTYANDARLRFEAFAATMGDDGVITLDDLAMQSLSDLRDRSGAPLVDGDGLPIVYDPGVLPLASYDLRAYVLAAATTTGHFNGEGHCDYAVNRSAP